MAKQQLSDKEFADLEAEFGGDGGISEDEFAALEAEFGGAQSQPSQANIPGLGHTMARKFGQGVSFGFGDELGGVTQQGIASIAQLLGGTNPYAVDEELAAQGFTGDLQPNAYEAGLQSERDLLNRMSEARPKTSFASEMAGMIATAPYVNPVAGAALQGFGSGEGATERILGAGIGAASVPVAGAAGKLIAREAGPGFNAVIKPGVKNLYNALTNHTGIENIPVMEALSRQVDKFRGQALKTNAKKGIDIVDQHMTKLNKDLGQMTKAISDETQENMLMQFSGVSDTLREAAEASGNKSLLRSADKLDESILSGNYEDIVNAYRNLIKKHRVYDRDGNLVRYVGDNTGALEAADQLFMNTNNQFLDDTFRMLDLDGSGIASQMGKSFKQNMSDLKDLHLLQDHLSSSARVGRNSNISIPDSIVGGSIGAGVGGAAGGPVGAAVGGAVGAGASAAIRRSVMMQNSIFKFKDMAANNVFGPSLNMSKGVLNRSVDGVNKLVQSMGGDLLAEGANPTLLSAFSRAVAQGGGALAEPYATAIMNQFPQYFEDNGYASEVDGRLMDPNDIEIERDKITRSTSGNIKERAKALSGLNKDGQIYKPQPQPMFDQTQRTNDSNRLQQTQKSVNNAEEIDRLFKNQPKD